MNENYLFKHAKDFRIFDGNDYDIDLKICFSSFNKLNYFL